MIRLDLSQRVVTFPKRLRYFLHRDPAGLGRYFGFNVTARRVFAVLLLSGGGVIVVYFAPMLPMPYAPPEVGGKPLRWLPGKCRAFVEFLRTKLHLATG